MRPAHPCIARLAAVAAGAAVSACLAEGIDPITRCQFLDLGNGAWVEYGFAVTVEQPPPEDCPVSLTVFGTMKAYSAVISAPNGTPIDPFTWRIFNATDVLMEGPRTARFGFFGADGRQTARLTGQYPAGSAGFTQIMQDRVRTEGLANPFADRVINDVFLPYKCCAPPQAAIAATVALLPRAKRGRATTIRVFPNIGGLKPNSVRWYLNGAEVNPPSNNPWNPSGPRTAYTHTYSASGAFNWRIVMRYGFPEKSYEMKFKQHVDP